MYFEKSCRRNVSIALRRQGYVIGLSMLPWIGGCGGVFTGISDLDTPDGQVSAQRCAACHGKPFGDHGITHGVPDPRFRTMAEWEKELSRMEGLMQEKGLPPLVERDREAILHYLSLHAKP